MAIPTSSAEKPERQRRVDLQLRQMGNGASHTTAKKASLLPKRASSCRTSFVGLIPLVVDDNEDDDDGKDTSNNRCAKPTNKSVNVSSSSSLSMYHETIQHQEWDQLENLLNHYKKPKTTTTSRASTTASTTPRRSLRISKYLPKRSSAPVVGNVAINNSNNSSPLRKSTRRGKSTAASPTSVVTADLDKDEEDEESSSFQWNVATLKLVEAAAQSTTAPTPTTRKSKRVSRTSSSKRRSSTHSKSTKIDQDQESSNEQSTTWKNPLLERDEKGQTPLMLACHQSSMPSRLLQKLLFLERSAAAIPKTDPLSQWPLHVAVQTQLDPSVLDRLIYAHPAALWTPFLYSNKNQDGVATTTTATALVVRQACAQSKPCPEGVLFPWRATCDNSSNLCQDNLHQDGSDGNKNDDTLLCAWQVHQENQWKRPSVLLLSLKSRRKSFSSSTIEQDLMFAAIRARAPPHILPCLLTVSLPLWKKMPQTLSQRLSQAVQGVLEGGYGISTWTAFLQIMHQETAHSHTVTIPTSKGGRVKPPKPAPVVVELSTEEDPLSAVHLVRKALDRHYQMGVEHGFDQELLTFEKENLKHPNRATILQPCKDCQEWWHQMRFLIGYASNVFGGCPESVLQLPTTLLIHCALCIPNVSLTMVQFLLDLLPKCVTYCEEDSFGGLAPIHLLCSCACPERDPDRQRRWLDMLVVTYRKEFPDKPSLDDLVWTTCAVSGRLAVGLALECRKTWLALEVADLEPSTLWIKDPLLDLVPFEMAAASFASVDVIYQLLRKCPDVLNACIENHSAQFIEI